MEPETAGHTAGAAAPPDPVRSLLREIRAILTEQRTVKDRLDILQRDLDELVGKVRALEGRS